MVSDLNINNNTTPVGIVIPTFNRSGYLQRALIYLNNYFDQNYFNIFVLDGSSEEIHAHENEDLCAKYGVRYKYYSPEKYTSYQRIHDCLCNLESEYFQILGDDDFLNPIAIKKCVEHLDRNSDCVAAFGHYILFNIKQNKSKLVVTQQTAKSNCSYDQDCPFDRLFWGMVEIPNTVYYAVKRTKIEIATFESAIKYDCGNFDFLIGDPLVASLTLLKGKMANINLPYLCRQVGQSVPRESILAGDEMLMPNKNFMERYSRARSIMLNHVGGGIDMELAGKAIDAAWGSFLGGLCLSPHRMERLFTKLTKQMSSAKPADSLLKQQKDPFLKISKEPLNSINSNQHNFTCPLSPDNKILMRDYGFSLPFISNYHKLTQLEVIPDNGFFWFGALEPRTVACEQKKYSGLLHRFRGAWFRSRRKCLLVISKLLKSKKAKAKKRIKRVRRIVLKRIKRVRRIVLGWIKRVRRITRGS